MLLRRARSCTRSSNRGAAGIRSEYAANHAKCGALAGSICAQEACDRPIWSLKRKVVDNPPPLETFCEIGCCDHRCMYWLVPRDPNSLQKKFNKKGRPHRPPNKLFRECYVEKSSAQCTTIPAYPTTIARSPDTSPEVAYFTRSADFAPSFRDAVSIATAGPKPHIVTFCCVTTS